MATVDFERVEKVYPGGTQALTDFSLRVADGELLVLVGPSGCGKSTVLRLLAGLEAATSGVLRVGDREVNDCSPQERNVAMVFQDYALYPFMSVRRNLEFPLRMRRLPREQRRRRVDQVAALLDIAQVLDRLPKQLSGGQRQRVAMGRALVREPSVFLLDEPLSNLDAKLRVQVRAEIGELQRRLGTTMLYVTHDQVEAMTLADRVAVLDRGRLQQVAAPRELYDAPANAFVAGFIGNPPMNLFPTRVGRDGDVTLSVGDQQLRITRATLVAALERGAPADGLTGGIRPEAFHIAAADSAVALRARVEHVEYLGHETLAHVRVAADDFPRLVARLPGMQPLEKGETIRLAVDGEHVHLFDATGRALAEGKG